jgi:hypothetical protein
VSTWNTFVSTWNTFGRGILPYRSASAAAHSPALSLRQPGKMSFPSSEDPLASFHFLSEFFPAIDFGEGFRFDEPFNFDDSGDGISMIATGGSPSYGAYDDDSCSFSVESSVQLRRRCRRHKRRSPNRLYRKGSVKLLVRVCPWRLTVPLRQRGGQRPSGLHATASTRLPRRLVWASSW